MVDTKDLAAAANALDIYKEKLEVKAGGLSLLVKQVCSFMFSVNKYVQTSLVRHLNLLVK